MSHGKSMKRKILRAIILGSIALVVLLAAAWQEQAQDTKALYPNMAPLEQYLISDRNAEIALARSAAPPSISHDATVMVLGRHGYETAVEGKNGFVASWNAHGRAHSTVPSFGTLRIGVLSASIRPPLGRCCRSL